ncbi:neuropeptides capa receptor [Nephila pilipes]|uniref:Neuropeptides capa receptor n=1 Tax=Nephila pilipes TaxID=299642 RepID=A0A8X6TY25_NEPPI|nr:neuropeptides capa receptor [Nephila pilipes]
MPLELYSLWHQYPWQLGTLVCISRTVLSEATAYASILTIVTFSCEQYYAVCHPLHQTTKSKVKRAFRNIVIIWIVSFITAAPYGLFTKVNYITLEDGEQIMESAWCGFPFNDPNRKWETLMLCSTFLFFVVPMTLISVLYFRISLTLYRARNLYRIGTAGEERSDGQRARIRSRMVVIKMLMTVVVAFFVCWAPYHSQRLLFLYVSLYGEWTETLRKLNQDLFSLAGCFYYFNSTINPILYSVMSNRFRVAFREKLCAENPCTCMSCFCCCCWKRWRDYYQAHRNRASSSASSSHRTPHANIIVPPPEPVVQPRLPTNLRENISPTTPGIGKYVGLSYSDEKRKSFEEDRPRFSSDPNFSLKLAVNRCRDFSTMDDSDYQLAREKVSKEYVNGECVSCISCNSVFTSKPKVGLDSSIPRHKKTSISDGPRKLVMQEESRL